MIIKSTQCNIYQRFEYIFYSFWWIQNLLNKTLFFFILIMIVHYFKLSLMNAHLHILSVPLIYISTVICILSKKKNLKVTYKVYYEKIELKLSSIWFFVSFRSDVRNVITFAIFKMFYFKVIAIQNVQRVLSTDIYRKLQKSFK